MMVQVMVVKGVEAVGNWTFSGSLEDALHLIQEASSVLRDNAGNPDFNPEWVQTP